MRITALAIALFVLLPACTGAKHAARTEAAIESDVPPKDFAIAVTVHVPQNAGGTRSVITPAYAGQAGSAYAVPSAAYGMRGVRDVPLAVRPARYLVEPDWVLRAAVGVGARARSYPPETRRLDAGQVRELYLLAREAGVFDPHHEALVSVPPKGPYDHGLATGWGWDDRSGERDERIKYIVSYALAGARRTLVIPVEGAQHGGVAGLVERLGELAWQPEAPAIEATAVPESAPSGDDATAPADAGETK